jgi:hypothetical protein
MDNPVNKNFKNTLGWQGEKIVPLYDASWNSIRWEEDEIVTIDLAAGFGLMPDQPL